VVPPAESSYPNLDKLSMVIERCREMLSFRTLKTTLNGAELYRSTSISNGSLRYAMSVWKQVSVTSIQVGYRIDQKRMKYERIPDISPRPRSCAWKGEELSSYLAKVE
jgi:hypothetical protein